MRRIFKVAVGVAAVSYGSGFLLGVFGPKTAEEWMVLLDEVQMWARIEKKKYEDEND